MIRPGESRPTPRASEAIYGRMPMTEEQMNELKRHFGVVAEALRGEIHLVAEGHDVIRREMREFREEVQSEFKEVRSLIKFSYAELDQRMTAVERDLLTLKTRMERLEGLRN